MRFFVKKIIPIRPTAQKIIRDDQRTDNRQTDRQTTDIFELAPIHMGGKEQMG